MIQKLFYNPALSDILLILFLLSMAIQLFYYLFFYARMAFGRVKAKKAARQPVSVVICARNEEDMLKKNLSLIMEQDYDDFEVIVVDDCSEDATAEVLEQFSKKYPKLKVTTIKKDEKFSHGKKLALTIGIKAASNEWLLLTDADCAPGSNRWISGMQKNFSSKTSVVLAYGPYKQEKGLLNSYIRLDTFFIGLQYMSFAIAGIPYMGVGRNLAYRKSLFFDNKGFASHRKLASGDDDLFINEVAHGRNTKVEYSPCTFTYSEAKKNLGEWMMQKKRHLSTGTHYSALTKWLLAGEIISRLLFYALFVILLAGTEQYHYYLLAAFTLRLLVMLSVFKSAMNRLNETNLFVLSFFYDLVSPFINSVLYIANIFNSRVSSWK